MPAAMARRRSIQTRTSSARPEWVLGGEEASVNGGGRQACASDAAQEDAAPR